MGAPPHGKIHYFCQRIVLNSMHISSILWFLLINKCSMFVKRAYHSLQLASEF